jgi:predicted permease
VSATPRPPRLAEWLLASATPPALREHLLGDLDEQFTRLAATIGPVRAGARYWRQALGALWHWRITALLTKHPRQEKQMSALATDLRQSVRHFIRRPSFPIVAILSLALAIAANGVVFGLVNGLVLNPFTFPDGNTLVSIGGTFLKQGGEEGFIEQHSLADIGDMAEVPGLVRLGVFDLGNRVLSYGETSDRVFTALIVRDPVPALGVPMLHGRTFTSQELAPRGPAVAIISHRVWVSQFGSDPAVIGRVIRVNSTAATLVGVLGPGTPLVGTDLWIPWGGDPVQSPRNRRQFTVIGRLADGASLKSVNAGLATVAARTAAAHGAAFPEYDGWRLRAALWSEAVTGEFFTAGALMLGAGVVVLIIACVNLGSLILARLNDRSRELAVRRALGASRWQVARLLVTETVLLWALASITGLILTHLALRSLPSVLPAMLTMAGFEIGLDTMAAAYCALSGLVGALAVTFVPAYRAREQAMAGQARHRGRRALIVAEVALAVMLLVTAGLFVRSYQRIGDIPLGFNSENVMTMRVTADAGKYPDAQAADFFDKAAATLAVLPGVAGAAAVNQLPSQAGFDTSIHIEGVVRSDNELPTALLTVGSRHLFDVMGMTLKSGRSLAASDKADTPTVVVVNEAFSRRFLGGRATGRLRLGSSQASLVEVVGVVADAKNATILGPARPEVFVSMAQAGRGNNQYFFVVRTSGAPAAIVPAARRALAALDSAAPMYLVQTLDQVLDTSVFVQRLAMWLVGVFGAGALIVAVGGVYGLVSFWVASRRREIGIRLALGGSSRQVVGLVVGQTARLVAIGTVLGLGAGIGAGAAASSLLYGTRPADPVTLGGVFVLLVIGGVLAAIVPAMRAQAVNPVDILRAE